MTATEAGDPIFTVLVLLAGGLASMAVSARTGTNFVLALIVFGVLLGPSGLGLASHSPAIHLLAELGVAFLLFDIGLHLSGKTLWDARRYLMAFAPLQIAGCSAALGLLLLLPPFAQLGWWLPATLSLSSTAVVLQLLREGREEQTPVGRAALAALLAQDLFVVLLLVALPSLGSEEGALRALLPALGRLLGALIACVLLGRYVLAPALGWIAGQDRSEAFTGAALFFVLSIAWLTHAFGLSLALGAFLAGLALAESRYAYAVQSEVAPFRGLLLALFFLSVGMSIAVDAVLSELAQVALLTVGLVGAKSLATGLAARAIGKSWGSSLRLGLSLSQGSEFAFVVLGVAATQGLLPAELRAPVEAAVVLSIAATPLLDALGRRAAAWLEQTAAPAPVDAAVQGRVVLIGFDPNMEALARALDRARVPFLAFTSNRERAARGRARGFDVQFGDRDRPRGLAAATSHDAAALVIGVDDDRHGQHLVQDALAMGAAFPIYAVTGDAGIRRQLEQAGIAGVVPRGESAAAQLAEAILSRLALRPRDVEEGVAECSEGREPAVGGVVSV